MNSEERNPIEMQDGEEGAIIEHPNKPRMHQRRTRPRRIKGKILRMGPEDAEPEPPGQGEGMERMPPMSRETGRTAGEGDQPPTEMEQLEPDQPQAETGEGYVRLRLHVENGEISVVGAKAVEGPLVQPEQLHGGLAFEVTRGRKQIGIGSITDAGVRRGFPNPEGGPEEQVHAIVEEPGYDFSARIPKKEFRPQTLSKINVNVYRVKGSPPTARVMARPLAQQFSEELRPVAQLKGIRMEQLPEEVQEEVRNASK